MYKTIHMVINSTNTEPIQKQNVVDWFNPNNPDHIRAFQHLKTNGSWPVNFIPDNLEFAPTWYLGILQKLVDFLLVERIIHNETL